MPVLKNKTQGNYVNVYKGIVLDCSLSLKDRGMLLTLLSLPDNWEFTIAGLGKILPDGKAAINSSLISLQRTGYLTKEQTRGKTGAFGENIIEVHETPIKPFAEKRLPGNRSPDNRVTGEPPPDNPSAGNQPQLNNKQKNNNGSNNQGVSNHPSIHHPSINQGSVDEMELYADIIRENISYGELVKERPGDKPLLDEFVALMTDIAAVKREMVYVGGEDRPYEMVKGKFLKLKREHIESALESMRNNKERRITNVRNYMLTVLFNALNTYDAQKIFNNYQKQNGGGKHVSE